MNAKEKQELAALAELGFDGVLSASETDRLRGILEASDEALLAYLGAIDLHVGLRSFWRSRQVPGNTRHAAPVSSNPAPRRKPGTPRKRVVKARPGAQPKRVVKAKPGSARKRPMDSDAHLKKLKSTSNVRWGLWTTVIAACLVVLLGTHAVFVIRSISRHRRQQPVAQEAGVELGTVTQASPGTVVLRGATRCTAGEGTALQSGDTVRVTPAGHAELRYRDQSSVALSAGTAVRLEQRDGAKRLHLEAGTLSCDVTRQPSRKPMRLTTAHAEATVISTLFRLSVEAKATRLEVDAGTVEFVRKSDGAVLDVNAGEYAVAEPGAEFETRPQANVLRRDGFEDLSPWGYNPRDDRAREIQYGAERRIVRRGRQALRLVYAYPGNTPGNGEQAWGENYRYVMRNGGIPSGATHVRMWVRAITGHENAQLYVQLRSELESWQYSFKPGRMPSGWHAIEFDLNDPMGYSGPGIPTRWWKNVPPMKKGDVRLIELGGNFADFQAVLDDLEFVRKAVPGHRIPEQAW
ncbi:MAG: FecR domain-containing protein [Kiritimatiellae bacterium]|nr:FecR domain-containing protein [Kiritimatiellia bacterium]